MLKVVWDNGNGAAGDVLAKLVAVAARRAYRAERPTIDGRFPAHHPDPTVPTNLEQLIAEVHAHAPMSASPSTAMPTGSAWSMTPGQILFGDQIMVLLARDVLQTHPGATIIADVKASQVLFDEIAAPAASR